MTRTVFYSWQSDLPNNTNRGLIRTALDKAIKNLNAEIFDSPREDVGEILIDQDTSGISGSPDIAQIIFGKIRESAIVVFDISIVGRSYPQSGEDTRSTDEKANGDESAKDRLHPNPNVLIEYGYALRDLGDEKILLIFNEEFGKFPDDLPFDIKHKRVIRYNASTGDSDEAQAARRKAREELTERLISDLKNPLSASEEEKARPKEHIAVEPVYGRSCWVGATDALGKREGDWQAQQGSPAALGIVQGPHLYLRLIPKFYHDQLSPADVTRRTLGNDDFSPMITFIPNTRMPPSAIGHARNKFGAFKFEAMIPVRTNQIKGIITSTPPMQIVTSVIQCFRSREIWGIDGEILSGTPNGTQYVAAEAVRATLKHYVTNYVHFSRNTLNVEGPLIVEMGASRIKTFKIALSHNEVGGEFFEDDVHLRKEVETENDALNAVDEFIAKLYAEAGITRD